MKWIPDTLGKIILLVLLVLAVAALALPLIGAPVRVDATFVLVLLVLAILAMLVG